MLLTTLIMISPTLQKTQIGTCYSPGLLKTSYLLLTFISASLNRARQMTLSDLMMWNQRTMEGQGTLILINALCSLLKISLHPGIDQRVTVSLPMKLSGQTSQRLTFLKRSMDYQGQITAMITRGESSRMSSRFGKGQARHGLRTAKMSLSTCYRHLRFCRKL